MSVPEDVRRRFSTMFVTHPPFAYEGAASPLDPAICGLYAPQSSKHQSYNSEPASQHSKGGKGSFACSKSVVHTAQDYAVCLRCGSVQRSGHGTTDKGELYQHPAVHTWRPLRSETDQRDPSLPDLDTGNDTASVSDCGPLTPTEHAHVLHDPRSAKETRLGACAGCHSSLRWVFVDEQAHGHHVLHRIPLACPCTLGMSADEL
jgi:hypothetical protein